MTFKHKHYKLHVQTTGTSALCIYIFIYFLNASVSQPVQKRARQALDRGEEPKRSSLALPTVPGSPQNRTFAFKLPCLCGTTIDSQYKIKKALL